MISDTLLFYIITVVLIYVFESRMIPQLLIFSMIVYRIYTEVQTSFQPIAIIITSLLILYCLGHIVNSVEKRKRDGTE